MTHAGAPSNAQPAIARLAVRAVLAVVAAVVATQVLRLIAVALTTVPDRFTPLQAGPVFSLTLLGMLGAIVTVAVLERRSADPGAAFRRIVAIVLPLSLIPDVAIWVSGAYDDAARAGTVLPLIVMHVAVAAIAVAILAPRQNR